MSQLQMPLWTAIPFVVMLAIIAIAPLLPHVAHHWERNRTRAIVAAALGIPVIAYVNAIGSGQLVAHSISEYVEFITLLLALYVISGGIFLRGDLWATPRNNTILLGIGGVLASFIGTTGAAMLLIRPLLNSNREREYRAHTVIFAILVIANCGGLLTPLGDPPLYLGLLRGVPFTWTFTLFPMWLFTNALLLFTYYAMDVRNYRSETRFAKAWERIAAEPLRIDGKLNILWFAVVVASVAFIRDAAALRVAIQLGAAAASYLLGSKATRFQENEFTWGPILEVAILFAGIFATMVPALQILRTIAPSLPLNHITLFVLTGGLSSVLDNAPTYLTFFEMAGQLQVPGMATVAGVPVLYLEAISLGAVTCGALTYIGNGPNFMVKAVAEEKGVTMPSFGGYVAWALRYLGPVLAAMLLLFIAQSWPAKISGALITALVVGRGVVMLRQGRQQGALEPEPDND